MLCRRCCKRARTVWLIGDFSASSICAICGKGLRLVSHINASRTKSCMVLTRSMANTNNVQGDKPCGTTLDRHVQTLATAVERLTQQNHDLEEQLHQRNARHHNQEEDQEGVRISALKSYCMMLCMLLCMTLCVT